MNATLTYSIVDGADITLLLKVLNALGFNQKISEFNIQEELYQSGILRLESSLGIITSRRPMYAYIESIMCTRHNGMAETSKFLIEQMLDFASTAVLSEIRTCRDLDGNVLNPLHKQLAGRSFVGATETPTIADWALFSLLFPKVRAFTPSQGASNYRVVRWITHLQGILVDQAGSTQLFDSEKLSSKLTDTQVFVPAVFDLIAMQKALDIISDAPASLKIAQTTPSNKKSSTTDVGGMIPIKSGQNGPIKEKKLKEKKESIQETANPVHPLARVDLRVGKVLKAEKHPTADRLYVEEVDLGEESPRTVVSGLVGKIPLEELQGRLCLFVCNLKPATLVKVLSSAMLLCASSEVLTSENGSTVEDCLFDAVVPPQGAKPGDRVTIAGVNPFPDQVIKPKEQTWEVVRVKLTVRDGVAHYEDSPLVIHGGTEPFTGGKISAGPIS